MQEVKNLGRALQYTGLTGLSPVPAIQILKDNLENFVRSFAGWDAYPSKRENDMTTTEDSLSIYCRPFSERTG